MALPTASEAQDPNFKLDEYAEDVAFAGFVGATGGMGVQGENGEQLIIPTTVEAAKSMPIKTGDMRNSLNNKLSLINDRGHLIEEIKKQTTIFNIVEKSANSQVSVHALIIGMHLQRLNSLYNNRAGWPGWIKRKLPFLKKRSREKYMAIASLPDSHDHLYFGVDRLADFGSYYNFLDEDAKASLGDAPMGEILKRKGITWEDTLEERKSKMDALVQALKLEKRGVIIEVITLENLIDLGGKFTGKKRDLLVKIHKDKGDSGITDFIKMVTEENGAWDKAVAKFYPEENKAESKAKDESTGTSIPVKVESIPELTTSLSQSIRILLEDKAPNLDGVQLEDLDKLLENINALKTRIASNSQQQ